MHQIRKRVLSTTSTKVKASERVSLSNYPFLKELGIGRSNAGVYHSGQEHRGQGETLTSVNPATGQTIASFSMGNSSDYEICVSSMDSEREKWMKLPMPVRGEIVR